MPPKLLTELNKIDTDNIVAGPEQIRRCNPQRFEFEQLDSVVYFNPEERVAAGIKDIKNNEFWVRGHIPGRPLFPGVLMCESAAQLCSYYFKKMTDTDKFLGFGGLDNVKFRGQVKPEDRFLILAKNIGLSKRRAVFDCQGLVAERMVFQGRITGMPI